MPHARPLRRLRAASLAPLALLAACGAEAPPAEQTHEEAFTFAPGRSRPPACDPDNGGLMLPPGFCALVVAEDVGRARHLAVRRNGDIYLAVNPAPDGSDPGRLLALRDRDGDGRADLVAPLAGVGGNGVTLDESELFLYFAQHDRVVRYLLLPGLLRPVGPPAVVVSGLPADGDHKAKTVVLDHRGGMYVNQGSASNACQVANRSPFSPGRDPCPELAVRAGVWRYSAIRAGQTLADGRRFAAGVRNGNALALQPGTGDLWAVQNGRDQLFENWPDRYTEADDRVAPSEELLRLTPGYDNGWPYCYEDPRVGAKVLAPEYGGDGRARGRCAAIPRSALTFPAHWAPLGMAFYTGRQFPAPYRGDAFVTTHGARFPSGAEGAGYNVMRVRFERGRPVSREVFADGFAGATPTPEGAAHRPVGVAVGPDGSLYVSSDQLPGRVWRIVYTGR